MYGQDRDEILRCSADLRQRSANARARAARTMAKSRWLVTQSMSTLHITGHRQTGQQETPGRAASPDGARDSSALGVRPWLTGL